MKFFKFIFPLTLLLSFCACHKAYKRQQFFGTESSAGEIALRGVFTSGGALYFHFEDGEINYYLYSELSKKRNKTSATLQIVKDISALEEKEKNPVTLADIDLNKTALQIGELLAPQKARAGVVLATAGIDLFLYRDAQNKLQLCRLSQIPPGIEITGKIKKETLRRIVFSALEQELSARYPQKTKFIIPVINIANIPFFYIDTEARALLALDTADFYKIQKDISPLGFAWDMLYSFFVKSHAWNAVKAPFTTLHKAASATAFTLYAALPPSPADLKEIPAVNASGDMMDKNNFDAYLQSITGRSPYYGSADILVDGEAFFTDFMMRAAAAQKNIFVRLYIFETDPFSLEVAQLLKNKSNQGVNVRVLIDELNTVLNWNKTPDKVYSRDYIQPEIKSYLKKDSNVHVRTGLNPIATFDHTKVIIIDEETAYTGGMNIGERYRFVWHDMMLRLNGTIVKKLANDFKNTWAYAGAGGDYASIITEAKLGVIKPNEQQGEFPIRVLYTMTGSPEIFLAQMEAIKRAKSRIYIQNAYFSDNRIIDELIRARGRGVDVRVILPAENDVGLMEKSNPVKANILLKNGIRVYSYPRMSHIKAAIYDNWATVGSANFDKMSLYVNQEMNLGIDDEAFVEELNQKLFQKDFRDSQEITEPFDTDFSNHLMSFFAAQG